MKQNKYTYESIANLIGAMSLLLILIFTSCKTTPPPKPQEPIVQENLSLAAQKARAEAIKKGADKIHAELFSQADKRLEVAKALVGKNRDEAIKEFEELVVLYNTLGNLAEAHQIKADIDEMGFSTLNMDMYKKAENLYNEAVAGCGKDGNVALKASEEALLLYGELCDKGFATLIEQAKAEAKIAKKNCDSINASRSMANDYNEAVKFYNEGGVATKEKRYGMRISRILQPEMPLIKLLSWRKIRKKRQRLL